MNFRFYHGPDKHPVAVSAGALDPAANAGPFHGIPSRGLVDIIDGLEDGLSRWIAVSPYLDRALMGVCDAAVEDLGFWLRAARENHVLSYAQSARAARLFVTEHADRLVSHLEGSLSSYNIKSCELWSVKEGHTASVWRATLRSAIAEYSFALNVARDAEADRELKTSFRRLERLGTVDPASVAQVFAIGSVDLGGGEPVSVAAVEWIEGRELHLLSEGQFFILHRFVMSAGEPGRVCSVTGARCNAVESDEIWSQILACTLRCTEFALDGASARLPGWTINEGDWVWDSDRARLIALSEDELVLPLGVWVFRSLLMPGGPFAEPSWSNPARAVEMLRPVWQPQWSGAVFTTTDDDLRRFGVIGPGRSTCRAGEARALVTGLHQKTIGPRACGNSDAQTSAVRHRFLRASTLQ